MRLNKKLALKLGEAKRHYDYDKSEYVVDTVDVDLKNVPFMIAGLVAIGLALWGIFALIHHNVTTHQATHNRYVQTCDYMAGNNYHYITGDSYVTTCKVVHLSKNAAPDITNVQIN